MIKQGTIEGYPSSAADFTVNDDVLQGLKTTLAEKITCRESLNSSGTVSRKTSTASDYTPEHTVSRDSRPPFIDQTSVSFSTESCMSVSEQSSRHQPAADEADSLRNELNDSLRQKDVKLVPGAKVDLKVFILQQDPVEEADKPASPAVADAEEKPEEAQLKVPQRKISRFLVSPVLSGKLDVPKEKEVGNESAEAATAGGDEKETEAPAAEVARPQAEPEAENAAEAPVLGPEMINTLEQLKISLDNLKNSSHPAHKKETGEEVKKSTSAADVTAPAAPPKLPATSAQPAAPFVPTSTIYQNAAISMQPVVQVGAATTTVPQTVPVVQPVAAAAPLQPVVVQYVAAQAPVPVPVPAVVTTSVPVVVPVPVPVQVPVPVPVQAQAPKQEEGAAKQPEVKKVLENLRHVADR